MSVDERAMEYAAMIAAIDRRDYPDSWGQPQGLRFSHERMVWVRTRIQEGIEMRTKTGSGPAWLGRSPSAAHLLEQLESRLIRSRRNEAVMEFNNAARQRARR